MMQPYINWFLKEKIQNKKQLERALRKYPRETILLLTLALGLIGNFLYAPWVKAFVDRWFAPDLLKEIFNAYFIAGNGTTNGILTAIPLVTIVNDILRVMSDDEKKIYATEIPRWVRNSFLTLGFLASAWGQFSPAYLASRPTQEPWRGGLLMFSNVGFTWMSMYLLMCNRYVAAYASADDKQSEIAKAAFVQHVQVIRDSLPGYKTNNRLNTDPYADLSKLIKILGKEHEITETEAKIALRILYLHDTDSNLAERPNTWSTHLEKFGLEATSYFFLFWLLTFHWFGGGKGGEDMISLWNQDQDSSSDSESDSISYTSATFLGFAISSVLCVYFLSDIYMHGAIYGVYHSIKNFMLGYSTATLAETLYPNSTLAWQTFSILLALGSWAFAAEHILSDYPEGIKEMALGCALPAVVLMLGYGMLSITPAVIFLFAKHFASEENRMFIVADEKLAELQQKTAILHPRAYKAHVEEIQKFLKKNIEEGVDSLTLGNTQINNNMTAPLLSSAQQFTSIHIAATGTSRTVPKWAAVTSASTPAPPNKNKEKSSYCCIV